MPCWCRTITCISLQDLAEEPAALSVTHWKWRVLVGIMRRRPGGVGRALHGNRQNPLPKKSDARPGRQLLAGSGLPVDEFSAFAMRIPTARSWFMPIPRAVKAVRRLVTSSCASVLCVPSDRTTRFCGRLTGIWVATFSAKPGRAWCSGMARASCMTVPGV